MLCADYQVIVLNSKYTVVMPISIEFKVFHRLSFCHNHESKFNGQYYTKSLMSSLGLPI